MKNFGYKRRFRKRPYRRTKGFAYKGKLFLRKKYLRSMVKKIVNRKIETKDYCNPIASNASIYEQTNYVGMQNQTFNCINPITVGAGNGQRIGDVISPVRWYLKGCLTRTQPGASGQFARIIVFSVKDYNADIMGSTLPAIEAQNFFRVGTTTAGCNGYYVVDNMAPINTNRITVHYDKQHFIGTNVTPVNQTSGEYNGGPSSRPFCKFTVNLTKHAKKLRYDENSVNTNYPINHNLFCAILLNTADATVGGGTTEWLKANIWSNMYFKDA